MKKALIVALVVLLAIIGLPVLMPGMGGAHCAECAPATTAGAMCFAVLAASAAALLEAAGRRRRLDPAAARSRLVASLLERPPQLLVVR